MIRFVIFDVMGVIFTVGDDVEGLLIPYIHSLMPKIPAQSIRETYLAASLGKITSFELWASMGFKRADIPAIERDYLEKSFTLDAGFITCAKVLKNRYSIALLSNDVSEWSKYLRRFHGIEPMIDAAFISGDFGLRKPDAQTYLVAMDSLGARPSECVFIDDSPQRVDVANNLGMSSILFEREEQKYDGPSVRSFEQLTQLLL